MKMSTDHDSHAHSISSLKKSSWNTIWVCAAGAGTLAGVFGLGAALLGAVAGGMFGLYASRRNAR